LIEQAIDNLKLGLRENDKCNVRLKLTQEHLLGPSLISVLLTTLLSYIQSLVLAIEFIMVCTMPKLSIANPIPLQFENIHQAIMSWYMGETMS
jgi:hypothetical protein